MKSQNYLWHPNTQMLEWEKFPKIVLEMEEILSSFTKKIENSNDEFSEEETEMIEDELRKMGYV